MIEVTRYFSSELSRRLEKTAPFLQIVLGPRQVGKTTAIMNIGKNWAGPFTYASADSPSPPTPEWVREKWQSARGKGPGGILALDEIQKISGWSEIVKILFDEERQRPEPLRVVLLGSASWSLQQGLTESLAGRFELVRAGHWSFAECHRAFGWPLNSFLKFGGYPAPASLIDEVPRWQSFIRDSIIEPILSRDLLPMRAVTKPALFRQTLELALRYPAQEISLEKLLGQLQDSGNSTTIRGYLDLLEAGFVIKSIPKYSSRPLSIKTSSPKLIPLCPALIHGFESPARIDSDPEWRGRVFEAVIGAQLLQAFEKVYYFRDRNHEVDFVVEDGASLIGIEVKSGRARRQTGIAQFKKAFKNSVGITVDFESGEQFLLSESPAKFLGKLVR